MAKARREIERIVREYIANLKAHGARVEKVILYGSHAARRAGPDSDIDIAVISPYFQNKGILERQEFLGDSFGDIYDPIEPLGYTPEEFENAEPGTLLHEIKQTGKVIYDASDTKEKIA